MKSEAVETDRIKTESRQSIHRRKMSKNSSIVNGADESLSYAAEDESLVRQINLAAALHDHISCTKSAELCKIEGTREARVSLPCETDHIYANCSEKKNKSANAAQTSLSTLKDLSTEIRRLRFVVVSQYRLIKQYEAKLLLFERTIMSHRLQAELIRSCVERKDRMCLLRKHSPKPEECTETNISEVKVEPELNNTSASSVTTTTTSSTTAAVTPFAAPQTVDHSSNFHSVNLVTRYFGRRSKTVPSRALKRHYLGPPKTIPCKQPALKALSSATSVSSESEVHEEDMIPKPEVPRETKPARPRTSLVEIRKISKKRNRRPKGISRKMDFLTTDKAYFLPDNQTSSSSLVCSETLIDVPSWKLKPVTSFYQMEGTENINDPVFQRRHLKCEQDERRRKRWDIQRLREQKVSEKLKYKYCRDVGSENNVQQKSQSFYPDPRHIQYIEVTDQLPVLAFGHLIPLFQPSEFSISWTSGESQNTESTETSPNKMAKKSRLSSAGPKVT